MTYQQLHYNLCFMSLPPSGQPESEPSSLPGADFAQVEPDAEVRTDAGVVSPEAVTIAGLQMQLARVQAELQSTRDELTAARAANEELSQANDILLERYLAKSAIERYLTWKINHDELTDLMTERAFKGVFLADMEAHPQAPRVVFGMDLGNTKTINDSFGHPFGDEVIKFFAAQISRGEGEDGRRPDFFARRSTAGDEFLGAMDATPYAFLAGETALNEYMPRVPRTPYEVAKYQVLRFRALRTAVLEQFPELRGMDPQFYVGVAAMIYNPSATYEENFKKVDLALLAQKVKDQAVYGSAPGRAVGKAAPPVPKQSAPQRMRRRASQGPRLAVPRSLRKKPGGSAQ